MIETINDRFDLLDYDNPYLDDVELEYLDNGELDFDKELADL